MRTLRERCASSEGWDRVVVQKVALLTPAGRKRCSSFLFFWHFLTTFFGMFLQVNVDLKCRMVTWVYLDVLIYFELFLQVNMDLWHMMIT